MKDREKQIEELKSLMLEKSDSANVEPVFTDENGEEHSLPDEAIKVLNDILEQAFIPFLAEVVIDSGYGNISQSLTEFVNKLNETIAKCTKNICLNFDIGQYSTITSLINRTLEEFKNEYKI